jgi:hypothetical protein
LKGDHPRTIPTRFGLIWFSSFRGEDLNVIFYQNIPNLHNWYKSAERKISQKNPRIYVKLLLAMWLQLKFELILTYTKAAMDNSRNFYF